MEITPLSKLSSVYSIHDFLNKTLVIDEVLNSNEVVSFNLSDLKYITPIGYTSLLSIIDHYEKRFVVKIKAPKDERPIKFMERMNFFEVCSKNIKSQFDDQVDMDSIYKRNRYNLETELMEIKKAQTLDDIENIYDSIKKILRNKGFSGPRLSNIQTFITELGNNVIEHTDSPCFISIKNNDDERKMEIAVSDNGIGIYRSLKNTLIGLSQDMVVKEAIMTKASRSHAEGRGNGLMDVKQKAFHKSNEVSLQLCTNNTVYDVLKDNVVSIFKGPECFGTFFQIKITYPIDKK
jgi:anti-sigma regulatory factor (Ser/Thr protein kinase)